MTRSRLSLWLAAFTGFYRPAVEEVRLLDPVSKFLYAGRSVILVISAQSALVAGLLAAGAGAFSWIAFLLVLAGFVVAHMISNFSNDYFDFRRGHDTPDSPRMRYTVHPLASGVLEPRTLVTGLVILSAIGLAIMVTFILWRGWSAVAFAAAGVALLFLYDAAPVPLKTLALGEVAAFLVWGPLMVGGGYAMIAGQVSVTAMLAGVPVGLGVMSILVGKHIDQREFDAGRRTHTLPVVIGERAARLLNIAVLVLVYVLVALLALRGAITPFALLAALALPRALGAMRRLAQPRPAEPPPGYVGWPLWYHRACLVHHRLFGWAYLLGLALGAALPGVRLAAGASL